MVSFAVGASVGQSIGMAKNKKAQVLETKGVTISKEPTTVKGNRYSSYRITSPMSQIIKERDEAWVVR